MLVFLDESGDAGFKFNQGSSTHFVIALVIFASAEDAESTASAIKSLRQQLRLHSGFEFKFNKMSNDLRSLFLERVKDLPFRICALLVDKQNLDESLKVSNEHFYQFFVAQVLQQFQSQIQPAKLRVDGSGSREFKNAFKTYLRQKLGTGVIADCKFVDSASDSLIQLADMVSGALYRSAHLEKSGQSFLDLIRHKVEDILFLGATK